MSDMSPAPAATPVTPQKLSWYRRLYLRVEALSSSKHALAAMLAYHWPGNVRELANRVQRALVMCDQPLIRPEDLGLEAVQPPARPELEDVRVEAEKIAIRQSLERVSHNVTLAARDLGVSRMTLYRLMAKHSITPRERDGA